MRNPDRIDFSRTEKGTVVTKFWRASGQDIAPGGASVVTEMSFENMLQWCNDNGYTVYQWHRGARAWKGEPWPIRTRSAIVKKRKELEAMVRGRLLPEGSHLSCDLAYYF